MVRAAWLSYVGGLTQGRSPSGSASTGIRVNRMLAQARDQGIVQVRINSKIAACVDLEEQLAERYGSARRRSSCHSRPIPRSSADHRRRRRRRRLSQRIRRRHVGRCRLGTDPAPQPEIGRRPADPGLSVVSLLGGLTRGSALNVYEIASRLAELFAAECFYIAAPIFTDTEATRDLLIRQPILEDAFEHARKVDLAFVSVGGLDLKATNFRLGARSTSTTSPRCARRGAVGDICAHWIDETAAVVDHPLNRRVIALSRRSISPTSRR